MTVETHLEANLVIVDDDLEICSLFARIAKNLGFQVSVVEDGRSFINHLASNRVDVAILDLVMPDMDGFEVISALRKTDNPPALLLTSGSRQDLLDSAARFANDSGLLVLGAISKPIDLVALKTKLSEVYKSLIANSTDLKKAN